MQKLPKRNKQSTLSPASQMAFAVAGCAFASAGIGSIVNHWLTGWMAVGGMCGVGLFYLAIGILNLRPNQDYDGDAASNISQKTARAANLVGEPVSQNRKDFANSPDSSHLLIHNEEDTADSTDKKPRRSQ